MVKVSNISIDLPTKDDYVLNLFTKIQPNKQVPKIKYDILYRLGHTAILSCYFFLRTVMPTITKPTHMIVKIQKRMRMNILS